MDWSKVYNYCERGGDPGFWAEPLNAISNGAFVIAGLIAAWQLARSPRKDCALFEWLMIVLVICIGIGSFMFHTYATVWAIPFDTIPISLFMLAYLGYALRRFAGAAVDRRHRGARRASISASSTRRASTARTSCCR